MAGLTTADFTGAIPDIKLAVQSYIQSRTQLKDYIRTFNERGLTVTLPIWGSAADVVVSAPSENVAPTASDITGGQVVFTSARVGGSVAISDLMQFSTQGMIAEAGKAFGRKIVEKMNQDIFAKLDGFSTAIGTTNTNISLGLIEQGIGLLEQANAPGPYTLAVTPYVWADLRSILADTSGSGFALANEILTTGYVTRLLGCDVVIVSDLVTGTSAGQAQAADIKCGLFSREALGINIASDFDVRLQRDERAGCTYVVGDIYYGVSEIKDAYGIELLVDNKD